MVHVDDLLHLIDYDRKRNDDHHRAIYDYFNSQNRTDVTSQLERLYIFNYLIENADLHSENFGFLYDSSSFRIIGAAAVYDCNNAFICFGDASVFYAWILEKLPEFIRGHADIKERLQSPGFLNALNNLPGLTLEQKDSVRMRAQYLREL
jgi:hypothetical protein